nr:hypothetical protein [Lachnospiraceae bacterium]
AVSNSGTIKDCYVISKKGKTDNRPLVASNNGTFTTSAMLHKGSCLKIVDGEGRPSSDYPIQKTSDIKKIGFDTNTVWEYSNEDYLIRFQNKNWKVVLPKTNKNVLHIKTIEQYIGFADKVNAGDKRFSEATVYLENDLDFKGKNIPIIGKTRANAFAGTFDGRGHMIWNGNIKDEEAVYVGLFGYLRGKVVNLTFDGRVTSDKNLAGICGYNMGNVSCCGSVIRLKPKDERYNAAGIVTTNEGTVDRCYCVFEKRIIIPPYVFVILIALISISVGALGYFAILSALDAQKDYAKIEPDPGQEKSDDNRGNSGDANSLSFTLYRGVEISRNAKTCKLDFTNPANNANKVVVELQVVNGAGQRVTVGSSKAVSPGYSIKSLPISNFEGLSGTETDAYIVLNAYNNVTEEKAMVKTELPVKVTYVD